MLILVTGGSGSGKSEFAENLAVNFAIKPMFYIATMFPFDEESKKKVKRHQVMRAKKEFTTIECFTNLKGISLSGQPTVLLECMSNLLANEMYQEDGAKDLSVGSIIDSIKHLLISSRHLIVVSNEVFSDGNCYDSETIAYIAALGEINAKLGQMADQVIEVVYGIPIYHKNLLPEVHVNESMK